ncbi:MAG TPA: TRAP transporter large permease [Candidatus Methylomirabilis sp.]|nr:TRAP transporter large permease [Candidatus Methylomirabilis sp.]
MPEPVLLMGLFLLLLFLDVPVAFAIGAPSALVIILFRPDVPLAVVNARLLQGTDSFPLLAVPFFLLAGDLMSTGGITRRLVNLAMALVGHITGGMSHVVVVTNMVMAGMSGSALADTVATGSVLIPSMKQVGYPARYSAAIVAAAGTIGPIIPPSVPFVILGLVANISVARLFLGGALPGTIMGLALIATGYALARRRGYRREAGMSLWQFLRVAWEALPALGMPLIVFGGILGAVFTPTEASAVAAVYALLVGLFIYRELHLRALPAIFLQAVRVTASITFIIATASLFSWLLTIYQVGPQLTQAIARLSTDPLVFLLVVNVFFLIVGCFMETLSALVLFVPVLMPTVRALHVDPVHFGVMVTLNLMIGLLTPPFGMSMFVTSRLAGVSLAEFVQEALPFIATLIVVLLLITLVPSIVLWIPNAFMGVPR